MARYELVIVTDSPEIANRVDAMLGWAVEYGSLTEDDDGKEYSLEAALFEIDDDGKSGDVLTGTYFEPTTEGEEE